MWLSSGRRSSPTSPTHDCPCTTRIALLPIDLQTDHRRDSGSRIAKHGVHQSKDPGTIPPLLWRFERPCSKVFSHGGRTPTWLHEKYERRSATCFLIGYVQHRRSKARSTRFKRQLRACSPVPSEDVLRNPCLRQTHRSGCSAMFSPTCCPCSAPARHVLGVIPVLLRNVRMRCDASEKPAS